MNKKIILILNNNYLDEKKILKLKKKFSIIKKEISSQKKFIEFLVKIKKKNRKIFCIFSSLGLNYDKKVLNLMEPNLEVFITPTTGLDHINLHYLKKINVKLMYLSQYPNFLNTITSTAEHTWSIIMALMRNITPANNDVINNNNWKRENFKCKDLKNKNLCIVGLGRIGKSVAKYGKFFGMNIYATEKNKKNNLKFIKYLSLNNLIKKADILTLHIQFNKKNKNIIKNYQLDMLKKDSILVNTSRGNLFSENKALQLLNKKKIFGLGLDVMENDSSWSPKIKLKNKFGKYRNKNLIITPHIGGNTIEARRKTSNFLLEKFLKKI